MGVETLWLETIDDTGGGIFLEVIIFIYCFCALALVCDNYLVLSLETFCVRFNIREDVAGATIMAMGSSAPELIISSLNTLQGESDLGVGAIIGSGMLAFSVLPGLCALVAGRDLWLKRRPLARDSITYLLALICLVVFFRDGFIELWEAAVLLSMYVAYVVMVVLSPSVRSRWREKGRKRVYDEQVKEAMAAGADRTQLEEMKQRYKEEGESKSFVEKAREQAEKDHQQQQQQQKTKQSDKLTPSSASRPPANDLATSLLSHSDSFHSSLTVTDTSAIDGGEDSLPASPRSLAASEEDEEPSIYEVDHNDPLGEKDSPSPSYFTRGWRVFTYPLATAFRYTCIECHHDGPKARWYPLTFLVSFLWVSLFSFLISAVAQRWNATSGLPLSLFGIVLVAVGAEIPDGVQSLSVARRGYGAMALSNSCGAQITNVLFGLGLPWTIANIAGVSRGIREGFQCERSGDGELVHSDCVSAAVDEDGMVPWRGVQVREHTDALIAASFQFVILGSFIVSLLLAALATRSEKAVLTRRKGLVLLGLYPVVVTLFCLCSQLIIKPEAEPQYYAPLED